LFSKNKKDLKKSFFAFKRGKLFPYNMVFALANIIFIYVFVLRFIGVPANATSIRGVNLRRPANRSHGADGCSKLVDFLKKP